jgi:putative iron-regulated protein
MIHCFKHVLSLAMVAWLVQTPADAPSSDSLDSARQAWNDARVPYAQTEAYRFYDGPVDAVEGRINAWPIDENLIDYVPGRYPNANVN